MEGSKELQPSASTSSSSSSSSKKKTLMDLNDDCLDHICRQLSLEDQLVVDNVCLRISEIMRRIWRYSCKNVVLTSTQLVKFHNGNNRGFMDFMRSICGCVEELSLNQIYVEQLRLLDELSFPKVKSLVCKLLCGFQSSTDQDTLLIARLFPGVTKLSIASRMTGNYIWYMSNLTELNLYCCRNLTIDYFINIFTTLRLRKFGFLYGRYNLVRDERIVAMRACPTLEELHIDDYNACLIVEDLLRIPNLQRFVFIAHRNHITTFMMDVIVRMKGSQITTIIYNDVHPLMNSITSHLMNMVNLQKLVLINIDINGGRLQPLVDVLHYVRECHIVQSRVTDEMDLLCFILNCHNLEILNISETTVDVTFLYNVIFIVYGQDTRSVPLHLYCYRTIITEATLDDLVLPRFLRISLEPLPLDISQQNTVDCEWSKTPPMDFDEI